MQRAAAEPLRWAWPSHQYCALATASVPIVGPDLRVTLSCCSLGIIDKCVALLKRGLPRYATSSSTGQEALCFALAVSSGCPLRYPASPEILAEVIAFCDRFQLLVGSSSSGMLSTCYAVVLHCCDLGAGCLPHYTSLYRDTTLVGVPSSAGPTVGKGQSTRTCTQVSSAFQLHCTAGLHEVVVR